MYGDNIHAAYHLKQKTLAHWVAQNTAQEIRLDPSLLKSVSRSGTSRMANTDWYWRFKIMNTDDPDVRQLEIEVSKDKGAEPLARLVTFTGIPHEKAH